MYELETLFLGGSLYFFVPTYGLKILFKLVVSWIFFWTFIFPTKFFRLLVYNSFYNVQYIIFVLHHSGAYFSGHIIVSWVIQNNILGEVGFQNPSFIYFVCK